MDAYICHARRRRDLRLTSSTAHKNAVDLDNVVVERSLGVFAGVGFSVGSYVKHVSPDHS